MTKQLNETLVESVRFDLRHWPAGQSLQKEVPTDVFSPNTLAHLRGVLGKDHRAQSLIAMAETPDWRLEIADELFEHLQTWLNRQVKSQSASS